MAVLDPSVLPIPPWQTAVIAQATTTTTTPAPGPVLDVRGSQAIVVIVAIGLALAFLWLVPWWVDSRRAYKLRQRAIELVGGRLLDAAARDGLRIEDLRGLLGTIGEVATSQRETARAAMSFILLTIVGVALAALLLSSANDAGDLRKTVIASILTLLGTIVGFYFGARAGETGSDSTAPPSPPTAAPSLAPPDMGWGAAETAAAEEWPPSPEAAAPTPAAEEPPAAPGNREHTEVEPEQRDEKKSPPEGKPNGEQRRQ